MIANQHELVVLTALQPEWWALRQAVSHWRRQRPQYAKAPPPGVVLHSCERRLLATGLSCRLCLVQMGLGWQRATAVTDWILASRTPDHCAVFGFSGALVPGWGTGTICLPRSVQQFATDCPADPNQWVQHWPDTLQALATHRQWRLGMNLVTAQTVVATPTDKRTLATITAAHLVDMETAAVLARLPVQELPWTVLRVVWDELEQAIPPESKQLVDVAGNPQFAAALRLLWRWPGHARMLWQLQRRTQTAARALRLAFTAWLDWYLDELILNSQ